MSVLVIFLAVGGIVIAAWAIPTALAWALTHSAAWVTRNLVMADPRPEYSRIDKLDGL